MLAAYKNSASGANIPLAYSQRLQSERIALTALR